MSRAVALISIYSPARATPIGFGSNFYGPFASNGTFSIFSDLETFLSAQATCNANNANLASAGSQEDWNSITQLIQQFWYTNSSIPNTPQNFYAMGPGTSYPSPFVGFNSSGVFQGCAWIGG